MMDRTRRVLKSRALVAQDKRQSKLGALSEAAEKHRASITVPDVSSIVVPLPEAGRRYIPIKDRNLHAEVRHRSLHKRTVSRRWGMR
jgi:hypothetical protein